MIGIGLAIIVEALAFGAALVAGCLLNQARKDRSVGALFFAVPVAAYAIGTSFIAYGMLVGSI